MHRRKLAILVGHADETGQSRFIKGFLQQAFSDDSDVFIFSMYRKYLDTEIREMGEMNIFNLIDPRRFDGIVILKDSIQTSNSTNGIERRFKETSDTPVLIVDQESELYDTVWEDDYTGMTSVMEHMIGVHGYKDIAFVSGKKWHRHALNRLTAYEDVMKENGLTVDEERIFHGDFWYTSGENAMKEFQKSSRGLPEAIVCANDEMAIGVCDAIERMGLKIPDDIAVAGYDMRAEGRLSPIAVTSCEMPYEELGKYTAGRIRDMVDHRESAPFDKKPHFIKGETCGCKFCTEELVREYDPRRKVWPTDRMSESRHDVYNMMKKNLLAQTEIAGFMSTVYSYAFQLNDPRNFTLCLASAWKDIEKDPAIRIKSLGFPAKMIGVVEYNGETESGIVSLENEFDTRDILPWINDDRTDPYSFFITPFFYESECFGYAVVSYGNEIKCYDEDYREWMEDVSEGFEALRRTLAMQNYQKLVEQMRKSKYSSSGVRYNELSGEDRELCDVVEQILDENLLTYHFQPIVSAKTGEIYSYEALMRSTTERHVTPLDIIKYGGILGRLHDIERATFVNVLSYVEEHQEKFGDAKVFINSIPGITMDADDIPKVRELLKKHADHTVVELTEESELTDDDLDNFKSFFTKLGVDIAIDDFGTGYSNINNLLRYMPNCVKIDRSLLSGIENKPQKQHFVTEIIKFCRDNGILSLAEGIESEAELRTVVHMGVDLIQGFYTAKPSAEPAKKIDRKVRNEIILYAQEKDDGIDKHIYTAGSSNRVSLSLLGKYGCTDIVVGKEDAVYRDIAIVGAPNIKTDMHMRILHGYSGEITLDNVSFSNIKGRPCIDIPEGCEVVLKLRGNNEFRGAGIRVAQGSTLTIEGEGNILIETNEPKYYGIGNDSDSEHGTLMFKQYGKIAINGNGHEGVCIGSGKGGEIKIESGQYRLKAGSTKSVGIGSISSEGHINIVNCSLDIDVNSNYGLGIGSLESNSSVYITKTSIRLVGGGNTMVGIGSCKGRESKIKVEDASVDISLRANYSTCIGALEGLSELEMNCAGIWLENGGRQALAFGGVERESKVYLDSSDTRVNLHNSIGRDTYASEDNIEIVNGRISFIINDIKLEREMKFT